MYEYEGLRDMFFIMLYGGATMMALVAALYLWLRSGNAVNREVESLNCVSGRRYSWHRWLRVMCGGRCWARCG